ncbi:hypothetical protein jhhlp_008464 [Lomentospora prolificans]|uniref:Berberine/berberine-like domain-containing protein n=1 Tax=Lomentospora prolificans TaxID=41688 RepID=A0A2N3MY47_9PEZI|nr:hypothetical protein jhhlp_008464 [Lomentospora prolificans]
MAEAVRELDKNLVFGARLVARYAPQFAQQTKLIPLHSRHTTATITFMNDQLAILAVQEVMDKISQELQAKVPGMEFTVTYVPLPAIVQRHGLGRGENVLGIEYSKRDLIIAYATLSWLDSEFDGVMETAVRKWVEETNTVSEELGASHPFIYHNFAGSFQDPLCSYGPENVEFLREVSKKYDPERVFQTLVPGGFKVDTDC